MTKSNGGKGSAPRPYSVDQETFSDNWERIFGQKKKQTQWTEPTPQPKDTKESK